MREPYVKPDQASSFEIAAWIWRVQFPLVSANNAGRQNAELARSNFDDEHQRVPKWNFKNHPKGWIALHTRIRHIEKMQRGGNFFMIKQLSIFSVLVGLSFGAAEASTIQQYGDVTAGPGGKQHRQP